MEIKSDMLNKPLKDDELIDDLHGKAKQIKEGALVIKEELITQEKILPNIDRKIDHVGTKMKKAENKLAKMLEKSSDSCLYWIIGIEFACLILFFMI